MKRLLFVMPFTPEIGELRAFYRDAIGLPVAVDGPFFVQFGDDREGAHLGLLAVHPGQKREIELCFGTDDIESAAAALRGRGVEFMDEIRSLEFGKAIHFRDPEGTLLSLLEPVGGLAANPRGTPAPRRAESEAGGVATAIATQTPRLETVIVNCRDLPAARAFYRDKLGLAMGIDSPGWVAFDAGGTTLALHPRTDRPERDAAASHVSLGFWVSNLMDWADEVRPRGVHFTTAPSNQGWGLFAGAADPEGNDLIFREPAPPPSLEEELAEAFEDDAAPLRSAFRTPVKKGARAVSRVAIKPEYKATGRSGKKKAAKKSAAKKSTAKKSAAKKGTAKRALRVHSTRGAGPVGARKKPKRTADPKRARSRPATGRMKKAEARSATRKKGAIARASKSKPVKRAVARRGRKR